ncbi:hypothetical protein DPEC_G00052910 [Dallia pectoralis]|uniref:Uncharacterized protein n=1 Tax=Dallia pectoralis TaxID=75939 RepID=A0ACC2HBP2_DALPE|nr:hypothetical protein DPEC_G00052910 [Dallia pectoralis]
MCVFSELLKLWPEFLLFRSSLEEEEVLPELENRRLQQRARLQRRRRREEKRVQEDVERFPEECVKGEEPKKIQWESREFINPNYQLSWSYSKYLAALEREEVLLRQNTLGVGSSSSTCTDSSSVHSQRSEVSRHTVLQQAEVSPALSRRDNILA